MNCIWCDIETTTKKTDKHKREYANNEHIISESVGGKETLLQGLVCQNCNTRLNYLDDWLKREDLLMLNQYQVSSKILGKPNGKKRKGDAKKRKLLEIKDIANKPKSIFVRNTENNISLGAIPDKRFNPYLYNIKFSKALHKCVVNILYNKLGYSIMKKNYPELISLVNEPNYDKFYQWHYAVSYVSLNVKQHFDPYWLLLEIDCKANSLVIVFPAMIALLGTQPNNITPQYLEKNAKIIEEFISQRKLICSETGNPVDITQNYGNFGGLKYNCQILRFIWRSEEIKGTPSNYADTFHLLVKCKTCWQTNPTGMGVNKKIFLQKKEVLTRAKKNSWNSYTKDDLIQIGFTVDRKSKSLYQEIINSYGINYKKEDLNRAINITDCKTDCIKCGNKITFSNEDLFV